MQDGYRILGNGNLGKMAKKYQHHLHHRHCGFLLKIVSIST